MPLIKPRTRGKQIVGHSARLDRENTEAQYAYAAFLGESTDDVLNQVIDTVLAKDQEFATWRVEHAHLHVPNAASRVRGSGAPSARHGSPMAPPSSGSHASLSVS
jgi:hypothetical protein